MTCIKGCPVQTTVQLISGKWKPIIIYHLLDGALRFGQIQKQLDPITQRSLTIQLRELEADGLVLRTIYPQIPPKVEYQLTELGASMKPIILSLYDWGKKYQQL